MLKKILLFLLLTVNVVFAITIKHADHSTFYRVVLQTDKPVKFKTDIISGKVLSIKVKEKSRKINKKLIKNRYIKSLDVLYSKNYTEFIFETTHKIKDFKVHTLKHPYRIVIDFYKKSKKTATFYEDPIYKLIVQYEKKRRYTYAKNFRKKIIVIDPGHGGRDPGAMANGLIEKNVNLKIAKRLKRILERDPRFKVYLTRYTDRYVGLYERTVIAVRKKADLFISIHCNSSPTHSESGTYVYTLNLRGAKSKLARLVEQRENKAVIRYVRVSANPLVNRIVADLAISTTMTEGRNFAYYLRRYLRKVTVFRDIDSANFAVLKTPGIPSVLIETLYLTDKHDAKLLKNDEFIDQFAHSIYNAIVDYFYRE